MQSAILQLLMPFSRQLPFPDSLGCTAYSAEHIAVGRAVTELFSLDAYMPKMLTETFNNGKLRFYHFFLEYARNNWIRQIRKTIASSISYKPYC